MYEPGLDESELAAFGLSLDDYGETVIDIWPESLPAFRVFQAMATQWRVGMSGPTGLDYSALPEIWRRLKIPAQERDQAFEDLQEMERAALSCMAQDK